jgi:hypothetical protein
MLSYDTSCQIKKKKTVKGKRISNYPCRKKVEKSGQEKKKKLKQKSIELVHQSAQNEQSSVVHTVSTICQPLKAQIYRNRTP